jgi:hypothetical protein
MGHALFNLYYWDVYWPSLLTIVEVCVPSIFSYTTRHLALKAQTLLMVQMLFMFGDFFQKEYRGPKGGKSGPNSSKDGVSSQSNGHKKD